MDSPIRPVPLGFFTITPGTPQQLTANCLTFYGNAGYGNPDNLNDLWARRFDVNPLTSLGRVFIGIKGMNKTTGQGVCLALQPGQPWTMDNPQQAQPYHVGDYWIDGDSADLVFIGADPS